MLILSCLSSVASKLTYFGEGPFSFNTNLVALVRSVVGQYQAASQQRLVLAASEEALFAGRVLDRASTAQPRWQCSQVESPTHHRGRGGRAPGGDHRSTGGGDLGPR
jgi:hypothetical protein